MLIDKIRENLRCAEEVGEDRGAVLELDAFKMAQALIAADDLCEEWEYDDRNIAMFKKRIRKAIESKETR